MNAFNKKKIIIMLVCVVLIFCSCAADVNGLYGNGIEYVDVDKVYVETLSNILSDKTIQYINESKFPETISRIGFKFVRYESEKVKKFFFDDDSSLIEEMEESDIFSEYNQGRIFSNKARCIITPQELFYTTEHIRNQDIASIVKNGTITLRKDLTEIFEKLSPTDSKISIYKEKSKEISNAFNIPPFLNSYFLYLDKKTLIEQGTPYNDKELNIDSDYILMYFNEFEVDDIPIYNEPVSWMHAGEFAESCVYFLFNRNSNDMEYAHINNIYELETLNRYDEFPIIKVTDAIVTAANYYMGFSLSDDISVLDVKLNYVQIYDDHEMIYDPAWIVTISDNNYKSNGRKIFVNAINGKVML